MKHSESEPLIGSGAEHMDDIEYAAAQEAVRKLEMLIHGLGFHESEDMRAISSSICPASTEEAGPIVDKWCEMGQALVDAAGSAGSIEYRKANLGFQLALAALYHWWGVGEMSMPVFDQCVDMVGNDPELQYLKDSLLALW